MLSRHWNCVYPTQNPQSIVVMPAITGGVVSLIRHMLMQATVVQAITQLRVIALQRGSASAGSGAIGSAHIPPPPPVSIPPPPPESRPPPPPVSRRPAPLSMIRIPPSSPPPVPRS